MWQLIGLGLAQTDGPVAQVETRELEAIRQASCPHNYQMYNNFCYRVFNTLKTWDQAEYVCRLEEGPNGQGHLVSILSEEENIYVTQLWLSSSEPATNFATSARAAWIGLSDTDSDGDTGFLWSDGEAFGYSDFKRPPNRDTFCAFLVHRGGFWTTDSCETKRRFICKVPL